MEKRSKITTTNRIGKKVFCNGSRLVNDKVISYRETGTLVLITQDYAILEENGKIKTFWLDDTTEFVGNIYTHDFERVYDRYRDYKTGEYTRKEKVLKYENITSNNKQR